MNEWGCATYGDPCRECGFSWSTNAAEAVAIVEALPPRVATALDRAHGEERHPDLAWSVTGYVLHVGDNLRIWGERVAGITHGDSSVVASYDENALAAVRSYDAIGPAAARWSLERSVGDFLAALRLAPADLVMHHPERGTIGLADLAQASAHDGVHHLWDIERTLQAQ
jgi:hypothetical protein